MVSLGSSRAKGLEGAENEVDDIRVPLSTHVTCAFLQRMFGDERGFLSFQ